MGSIFKSNKSSQSAYSNTTTSNPYAYSKTTNSGTVSGFQNGTAMNSVYNFVNNSIDSLLDQYLKPNLNSYTNQAKIKAFTDNLSSQTRFNLENNIINPLSNRNMIRSSQANDLYKNLANQNISSISSYLNELISNSQTDTSKMIANLLSYYMLGANYLSDMQNHSLQASSGNSIKSTENNSSDLTRLLLSAVISAAV